MSPTNSNTKKISEPTPQEKLLPLDPSKIDWLRGKIRDIPDFPKPGIVFKDLTTLLKDAQAFHFVVEAMAEKYAPLKPNYIAGIEARGFILASALAYHLNVGFLPIRKPGKLPYTVEKISYELEYGTDSLEIHVDAVDVDIDAVDVDAVEYGRRVIVIDDLLATGGTAAAAYKLLSNVGANVLGLGFLVELGFLKGRAKFPDQLDVFTLINFA